jgi:hypothetical protein
VDDFEDSAQAAIDSLPDDLRQAMSNVAIVVEDEPLAKRTFCLTPWARIELRAKIQTKTPAMTRRIVNDLIILFPLIVRMFIRQSEMVASPL